MKKLIIAGQEFDSRLFLGTGKFHSNTTMEEAILASGCEMVTVAMKRIELDDKEDDMLKHIIHPHIRLLPNTSGVRTAEEAVFAAQMAETGNPPRSALPAAGFHRNIESYRGTGKTGFCRITLLSGRPHSVQTSGRSRLRSVQSLQFHKKASSCT